MLKKINLRIALLFLSVIVSLGIFGWAYSTIPEEVLRYSLLTQNYALIAVAYLYTALLIGPLTYTFRFLPFRSQLMYSRRSIGVSAFYFALLHALTAFLEN